MKKLIALLLALAMALALAGCGSGGSTGADASDTAEPAESASASAEDAAPADPAASAEDDASAAASYPAMTLNVSCSYNEGETAGQEMAYFLDYITEHSDGAIQFNVYWGGTFCSSTEDLDYVGNGSVDLTMLSVAQFTDVLPLTNFPTMAAGSQEAVVDYVEYIMFENEETAALIGQELSDANVKVLGVNAGGTNAFCAKEAITNYEGLSGKLLGAMMNLTTYEDLGATSYFSLPPDTYSDLQRGVIDAAACALSAVVSLAWYEVAPYVVIDGMYSCSNYYTINQDTWNGLDETTQALFLEAADAAKDNSFVLNDDELQASIDQINDYNAAQGIEAEVVFQDDAHAASHLEIYMNNAFADCRTTAENAGKSAEMEIILNTVAEYLNLEL